ncbi:hypothetical protein QTP88_028823 [Uroleucon formosanum]
MYPTNPPLYRRHKILLISMIYIFIGMTSINKAHSWRSGISSVKFRFDGIRILDTDTLLALTLEDGDILDAYHS